MALLCGAILALPCAAQEGPPKDEVPDQAPPETEAAQAPAEAPPPKKKSNLEEVPMHRWGAITLSLGAWEPQQVGLVDEVAVVVPTNGLAYPLNLDPQGSWRGSVSAAYHLPKGMGSVVMKYDSMDFENDDQFYTPGIFNFLETQGLNTFRGFSTTDSPTASTRRRRTRPASSGWTTKTSPGTRRVPTPRGEPACGASTTTNCSRSNISRWCRTFLR
jgi:hypothetical protein